MRTKFILLETFFMIPLTYKEAKKLFFKKNKNKFLYKKKI